MNVNSVRVGEWMVSVSCPCVGRNGGGVCCCRSARSSGGASALFIPVHTVEYCSRVTYCSIAGCVVQCGVCLCVLFVWWGILLLPPPRGGGGWGHRGWRGGMVLKGGGCVVLASPSDVGVPRLVCVVAVLNGGSGGVV